MAHINIPHRNHGERKKPDTIVYAVYDSTDVSSKPGKPNLWGPNVE